jgi:hydroxymethylbilane synthase
MKDLPSEITEGLAIGAVPERVDPSDVVVSYHGGLSELPAGSKVGSSSPRRKAQLMSFRPDLEFQDLRGNLDTRIEKLENGECDGIIVAYAGLHRLNLGVGGRGPGVGAEHRMGESEPFVEKLPFDICLPAVGQGALAVQIRKDDDRVARMVAPLDDALSRAAVTAERALLAALGGGCQVPIAAVAVPEGDKLTLSAMVASLDGAEMVRAEGADDPEGAASLGERVAGVLLDSGAREILAGCDGS